MFKLFFPVFMLIFCVPASAAWELLGTYHVADDIYDGYIENPVLNPKSSMAQAKILFDYQKIGKGPHLGKSSVAILGINCDSGKVIPLVYIGYENNMAVGKSVDSVFLQQVPGVGFNYTSNGTIFGDAFKYACGVPPPILSVIDEDQIARPNAKWLEVGHANGSGGEEYYLDQASISRNGRVVSVWQLLNLDHPFRSQGKTVRSMTFLVDYDCNVHIYRDRVTGVFNSSMARGSLLESDISLNWAQISRGSQYDKIANLVCPTATH